MKIWKTTLILGFVCLLAWPCSAEPTVKEKIDELIGACAEIDLFSGTVLVGKDGQVLYSGAFGESNKDHGVPNKLNSRFNIGSIGKTLTATAVMQLAQKGKLKLTDPLGKFLPECPFPEKETITVHHLLNHSSGLGNYMGHPEYRGKMAELRSIGDVLPLIFDQKPDFQAGERFQYSNSGMVLLGAVIEKVSGLAYSEYLKKNIFEPLGMNESGIVYREQVVPNRTTGYVRGPDGRLTGNIFMEPPAFSDGGLYTTAGDLFKFDQALYGDALVGEEFKKKMFTPAGPNKGYAYGWGTGKVAGKRFVGHGGGAPGINAMFQRYIDDGYTVIVLSNYDGGAEPVERGITAILFDLPYEIPTGADADYLLGFSLQNQGEFKEALAIFEKNTAGDKPHLPSLYQAARTRILGEFDLEKAIKALDRYIERAGENTQPSIAAAWWRKGVAYEKLGQIDASIRCHEKALELEPGFPQAMEDLARLKSEKEAKSVR